MGPLLRFWKMDPSLPGVSPNFGGDSSAVRDQLKGVQQIQATTEGLCCDSGRWIRRYLGWCTTMAETVRQFEISSGVCSRFRPQVRGLCCDSGRCIRRYLGWCTLWRWQFGSSRSAQGCAANSSHKYAAFAAILEDGSVLTWGDPTSVAVTVRQFEISWRVCRTFRPHIMGPLLPFWKMDPSLPGVLQALAVTAQQVKISSGVSSRFKPQMGPLLRFWKMDPSLLGVMHALAVTVQQFNMNSDFFSTL